jgi:hypothetical protein
MEYYHIENHHHGRRTSLLSFINDVMSRKINRIARLNVSCLVTNCWSQICNTFHMAAAMKHIILVIMR